MLDTTLLEILVCPRCKGPLKYQKTPQEQLVCEVERIAYPVRDGIPVLLTDQAQDLSEQASSTPIVE